MAEFSFIANQSRVLVSVNELKRLLVTIADCKLEIGLRYRLIGEMWEQSYMRILRLTEYGLLLNDPSKDRLIVIRDLSQIMQFELDATFHSYQPNFHYSIDHHWG